MLQIRWIIAAWSALAGISHTNVVNADGNPEVSISAPVVYQNLMLVVVTTEGVAAIVFEKDLGTKNEQSGRDDAENPGEEKDQEAKFGLKYRYRFLKADADEDDDEEAGEGLVYERYTDGKYDQGELDIKAGRIQLHWSRGGEKQGWIYYQPKTTRVHLAHAKDFDDVMEDGGDRKDLQFIERLELRRFLQPLKPAVAK